MTVRTAPRRSFTLLRAMPRIAILTAALFAPVLAMQSVQAGSASIIESSYTPASGAGFVLYHSLKRR